MQPGLLRSVLSLVDGETTEDSCDDNDEARGTKKKETQPAKKKLEIIVMNTTSDDMS